LSVALNREALRKKRRIEIRRAVLVRKLGDRRRYTAIAASFSMMARLNMGKSWGLRDVSQLLSVTTG
jgi:hypothetical protein